MSEEQLETVGMEPSDLDLFQAGIQAPFQMVAAPLPDPVVYDMTGQQQSLAWLNSYWGVPLDIRRATIHPAAACVMRVTALQLHEGPATQIVRCVDQTNAPLNKVAVARWWPSVPNQLNPYPEDCHATRWEQNAVWGWTNANGDIGFGMGDKDMPGSSGVWPVHCQAPGDGVFNLGWMPGTNHRALVVTFMLLPAENPEPEPEPEPTPGDLAEVVAALRELTATIREGFRLE